MAPRSVLITGCSKGGAGEALARHFKQGEFRVFATARSLSKIQHLATEGIETVELDVLDAQSIKNAAATVSGLTGGTLDILINNAGAGYMTPITDVDNAKAGKLFDLNVFAPISVIRAFIPLLITVKGTIVNIGSYVDELAVPWQGIYNASKAALRAITDNLRLEIRPFNVNVVYIAAGGINTKFLDNLEIFHLRTDSLYHPAKELLEPIINYEAQKTTRASMPPEQFAQEVYTAATAGDSNYRAYAGTQTPMAAMPKSQRDDIFAGLMGINALAEKIRMA